MSLAGAHDARECLKHRLTLSDNRTPVWSLPGVAATLGVAGITVKDESKRSTLGSFKALGAPNALIKSIQRRHLEQSWSAASLFSGPHVDALRDFVIISATTDGNHGRAL